MQKANGYHEGQLAEETYQDKGWLAGRYVFLERTKAQIAKEASCSIGTIDFWLTYHGIPEQEGREQKARKTQKTQKIQKIRKIQGLQEMQGIQRERLEERFWAKIDVRGLDECWLWRLGLATCCGYGVLGIQGKMHQAHRVAWMLKKGSIPNGVQIRHKCDNKRCVNPVHLYPNTPEGRLWARVDVRGPDECWGIFKGLDDTWMTFLLTQLARNIWELTVGPISDKTRILRTCGTESCCNPAHLVLESAGERFWGRVDADGMSGDHWRFWNRVDASGGPDECWLWTGPIMRDLGYGVFNRLGRPFYVHRLAWTFVNGPIPDKLCVCHSCDNKSCCNPSHLLLGHTRAGKASVRTRARLTVEDVRAIRKSYAAHECSLAVLARRFGTSVTNIWNITQHRAWAWLDKKTE